MKRLFYKISGSAGLMGKLLLIIALLFSWAGLSLGAIPASERAALIALYNSTNGDNWTDNSGWKGNNNEPDGFSQMGSEGSWVGITVESDRVTGIRFWLNDMAGSLPSGIANLTQLKNITISNNPGITGSIPPELGNLTNLEELNIGGNNLTGSIPPELGNTTASSIRLNDNDLTGEIPPELGKYFRRLYLQNNNLTGPIPPGLAGHLDWSVDLSHNNLSGSIPSELVNSTLLEEINLSHNNLSGPIPSGLDELLILEVIDLSHNQLTGEIPPGVIDMWPKSRVDLSCNNLSGSIPTPSSVSTLDLSHNNLTGVIPPVPSNKEHFNKLNLSHNNLAGNIPAELGELQNLTELMLNGNLLTGSIPGQITGLVSLTTMDIGYNRLFTTSGGVTAFLNEKDPDWFETQTIAPTGLSAVVTSPSSVRLSWTPIVYTQDNGGYKVFYGTTVDGPWTEAGMTGDKSTGNFEVTGLNYGTTYYFTLKTQTNPHSNNKNTALSGYGSQVRVTLSTSPYITIDKTQLSFSSFLGSPPPAAQSLTVSNSGSGSLQWTASQTPVQAWLTLSPSSGGDGDSISVSVDHTGLA
ncbi:MAG: hypothetical protein GY940_33920, partial [bacterium]|nr:hypothetical protein [bacterium]